MFDLIVVDTKNSSEEFAIAARAISKELLVANVSNANGEDTHDSTLLAQVLSPYLELSTK
jgi:hypothetical protein